MVQVVLLQLQNTRNVYSLDLSALVTIQREIIQLLGPTRVGWGIHFAYMPLLKFKV